MVPGIDPKVDYVFKRLFGREQNRALLIHLLNAILRPPPGALVAAVEILNPFNDKDAWDDKLSIVDIKARDQLGREFDVEMELFADRHFRHRALYYWAKFHGQQLHEGDEYDVLRPTVSICLVNNILYPDDPRYHLRFQLRETQSGNLFSDHLEAHLLELPKFTLAVEQLKEPLDLWLYFFRHAAQLDTTALPAIMQVAEICRAMEDLAMLSRNELERERYEARIRVDRDERSRVKTARAEGFKEALIGPIRFYQSLLNRPVASDDDLMNLSLEAMQRLAADLERDARIATGKSP